MDLDFHCWELVMDFCFMALLFTGSDSLRGFPQERKLHFILF